MSHSGAREELARASEAIDLAGNLRDAERLRALAGRFGIESLAFLGRASREGSPPIVVAALESLAKLDLEAAASRAFELLADAARDADERAAAASVLAEVHTDAALSALLAATVDSPLVSGAALRGLRAHSSARATSRLGELLDALVEELRRPSGDDARLARCMRAVLGLGDPGLLHLVAQRSYREREAWLFEVWRSHPNVPLKAAAAMELLEGGADNAIALLTEGLPGANEATPRPPLGELDNADVRLVLAAAGFVVLLLEPAEAFDRLAPFFAADQRRGWFGEKRAEIILLLVTGQRGLNLTTWLYGYAEKLHRRGVPPDARWSALVAPGLAD